MEKRSLCDGQGGTLLTDVPPLPTLWRLWLTRYTWESGTWAGKDANAS